MSLLYTCLSLEQILENKNWENPNYTEIEIEGKTLIVEPTGSYEGRLVRLISSNSNDYLNPKFQPGNIIRYSPSLKEG